MKEGEEAKRHMGKNINWNRKKQQKINNYAKKEGQNERQIKDKWKGKE